LLSESVASMLWYLPESLGAFALIPLLHSDAGL